MIVSCPECELQISDKAYSCPHCGLPLKKDARPPSKKRNSKKRKRLPNGFGQINEIKNKNLRNPYRAMVTVGKTSTGKPICKILKPQGYFPTYNDAYTALLEYNKNPYDLDDDILVKDLYERWSEEYFATLKGQTGIRTITSAWSYCSSVYDMRAKDLRARHIKGCMEEGIFVYKGEERTPSPNTKTKIKSLFNLMLDYAVEYELVDRNYARTFNISDKVLQEKEEIKNAHIPFTDKEMELLWKNINTIPYVDIIIIQCYSGWRPQELGLIRLENVDWDEGIFQGGMKTTAGMNRIVPIHPKIEPLVRKRFEEAQNLGSEFLFNCTDTETHRSSWKLTYDKYQYRFTKIRDLLHLNPDHRPHDPRKHFITMAKKYKLDEYAIKYIIGHAISDLTEKVYTERETSWLIEEMQKIK